MSPCFEKEAETPPPPAPCLAGCLATQNSCLGTSWEETKESPFARDTDMTAVLSLFRIAKNVNVIRSVEGHGWCVLASSLRRCYHYTNSTSGSSMFPSRYAPLMLQKPPSCCPALRRALDVGGGGSETKWIHDPFQALKPKMMSKHNKIKPPLAQHVLLCRDQTAGRLDPLSIQLTVFRS